MKRLLALVLALAGCGPAEPELKLLTWPDYFAESTIRDAEKELKCRIKVDYIDNSETLRTKLDGGASGYDVVMPSDEVLPPLVSRGLVEKLAPAKLPNLKNLGARWKDTAHGVPYATGSTGLAWRTDLLPTAPDSWSALWDPKLAGAVSMLDDAREAISASMRLDGAVAPSSETIAKAAKRFAGWKPRAWSSNPKDLLVNGDVKLAQCYSGDALQAAADSGGKVAFRIPKEGGTLWYDSLCIAKGSARSDLAHAFIDFILRADVSAAITNERKFGNPNDAARSKISKDILENPLIFPSGDDLKRLAPLPPLGEDLKKTMNAAWAEIREK